MSQNGTWRPSVRGPSPLGRALSLLCGIMVIVGCEFSVPTDVIDELELNTTWPTTLSVKDTASITLVLNLPNGQPVTGIRVIWSSSDSTIATVRSHDPPGGSVGDSLADLQATLASKLSATVTAVRRGPVTISVQVDPSTGFIGAPLTSEILVLERWVGVTAGAFHSCAVSANKEAFCWGAGTSGELGNGGSDGPEPTPQRVLGSVPFKSIEAGFDHTCAQDETAIPYCWGLNFSGELGTGNDLSQYIPTRLALGRNFEQLSLGNSLSCGILGAARRGMAESGDLAVCWGGNGLGQLGQGSAEFEEWRPDQNLPVSVTDPVGDTVDAFFSSVSAGGTFACGIVADDGGAWCWGDGEFGQLGALALDGLDSGVGVAVEGPGPTLVSVTTSLTDGYDDIVGTSAHACGLTGAGEAWCWGSNDEGQLGTGTTDYSPVPVRVGGGITFVELSAGEAHTCGRTSAGQLFCWGWNAFGQAGSGPVGSRLLLPAQVAGNEVWAAVSAGTLHTCALTDSASGGAVHCWGDNRDGQLGNNTFDNTNVPWRVAEPE